MKFFICTLFFPLVLWATEKQENSFQGFVPVSESRKIYVDWSYAQKGQPTVVLINGLTYSTKQWDRFAQPLIQKGIGVVRYDADGMGRTLLAHGFPMKNIEIKDQVEDLDVLLKALKIRGKINLVGLSYGGGLGILYASRHPEKVGRLILMAPYTEPLKYQNDWILAQIWYTRQVQPWNPATDDELYAYFFRQIVYSTYPSAEPIVLEHPWKLEGVFRMGLGIRKFRALDVVEKLPAQSVHLVLAGHDQYIPRGVMEEFWSHVPPAARASKIVITNAEHKIPEDKPQFSAAWVMEILKNSPLINEGQEFEADPYSGVVSFPDGKLQLIKE